MTAQNQDGGGKMVRAALYCRVSTAVGQNPEMQVRELREFAERRGWKIADEYIDTGVSGAKDSRPELNRLMADAHRRRFDAVIVWKFDRFARSVSHLLKGLETFRALGIEFVSLSEQVDTTTPTGKMVFTVLGAVAELERSLIAERVRAGSRMRGLRGSGLGVRRQKLTAPGSQPFAQKGSPGAKSLRSWAFQWERCMASTTGVQKTYPQQGL